MKNMIAFARKRGGKSMAEKLAAEIMDAFNKNRVVRSSVRRICTAWLRPTVLLHTSDSNLFTH